LFPNQTPLHLGLPGVRFLRVAKSPAAPPAAVAYRVTGAGLEEMPDIAPPERMLRPGNVAGQAIANEVLYEQQEAAWAAYT
jgi:hypothetical protein